MNKYDTIIIGSGPVGLSLAKSLSNANFSVCVIDRQTAKDLSSPPYDGREVAITHFSKRILKDIGSWDLIDESCISQLKEAKVVNGHSPYSLHFDFEDTNQSTLG
ncbi:MAG: FAD-dependent monooxygenase, partial [Pseudomonadota bacterium]|nr:FAD-dependent monooxygenase [Pseudomonadota bacterium]